MVFTLGLRHTFSLWQRGLALVQFLVVQASLASFRAGVVETLFSATISIVDPSQFSLSDRIAIANANYGRDFGWHVLSGLGEPLAALTDHHDVDMFWSSYVVAPLDGHTSTLTEGFWNRDCHRIRSIKYPNFVVETFGHFDPQTTRATIRAGYINVSFTWFDRVRSPWWFFRRWLK
jgi:hypothetical protein